MKNETNDCITSLLLDTRSISTVAYALSMELDCSLDHETRKDVDDVARQLRSASETLAIIVDRLPKPKHSAFVGFWKGVVR
jgi:hypothetical protein